MNIYEIEVVKKDGSKLKLEEYKGKVLLIVNTATKCGFTPQYEELKTYHEKYSDKGLVVLDFPCNQFGEQAPGTIEEITEFCTLNYNTPYDLFQKVEVLGDNKCDLFNYLVEEKPFNGFNNEKDPRNEMMRNMCKKNDENYLNNPDIKWNFTKFLVDRNGKVVYRFEPNDDLVEVEEKIKELL